jgi:hypothetical protein
MVLLIPFVLYAQSSEKYLVSVDISQETNIRTLEELHLSVYHIFKGTLIVGASDQILQNLRRASVPFRVLDEYPESKKYFIVSGDDTGLSKPAINNQIIFDDGISFIIKDTQPNIEYFLSRGLTCVEMKQHPETYKIDKHVSKYRIAASLDSIISDVTMQINVDSVENYIQSLQDFGTRFLLADTRDSVAAWIQNQFEKMGYTDVVIDDFWYESTGTWQKNVIATFPGSRSPQNVYIVGGHHDSYSSSNALTFAPGADDNASGTTAVLEIARAIMESGYQPEGTIKFITFAAEEYGLHGSYDFAEKAFNSNMKIKLMINHDMISHTSRSLGNSMVDINYYTGSEDLIELAKTNVENHTILTAVDGSQNSAGSDSYSFWRFGFPTLISASVIPSNVEKFNIVDMGNGNSLLANWASNHDSDISGYHVYFGTTSGTYDTVFTTADTSLLFENLKEGIEYYIGISAFDLDMYESLIIEKSGIPRTIPISPSSVYAEPIWHAIELHWSPNSEFDISGYNVYRSTELTENYVKMNESIIVDTSITDKSTENAVYYYYIVTAVDHSQNESVESDTIRSRNVSLDQGILVVDESKDGSGQILSPTDEEVDAFYESMLKRFVQSDFDVIEAGGIDLADLGAYSSVIWHAGDFTDMYTPLESKINIQKYLEYGGNFLYTGFLPSQAFEGNQKFPNDFSSGDFIYDFLKIQHVENNFGSRFAGAIALLDNFNDVYTDSSKTPENVNYHLPRIEGIEPAPDGQAIFQYDTDYDTTSPAGSMKDQTVGVAYLGDDFKVVTLSFPLYYLQYEQAEDLIRYILKEHFSELLTIDDLKNSFPNEFSLLQNYPNPFNPTTVINYELSIANYTELNIYNLLGQRIATLVSEKQAAGKHQVEWNASGFASGVYFYSLHSGDFKDVKKMILLH